MTTYPTIRQVVLDSTDARSLAEFYRKMFGLTYRPGDEPPAPGDPDENGQDWLVLRSPGGGPQLAFQQTDPFPRTTWPEAEVPQQYHLDTAVDSVTELDHQHDRALELGATLRYDRSEDKEEPLRVYADPDGHLFCIFVG
ncbi:catechol 2,3-dioxygenase-like lactoylglutathione lyase family enzyme [Actinoplanes tereljensis]|uniref:Glyoxalase n=1 Tax=Paractinoplanes tereljensis TaxID=571912 RepID=A0A919TR92_9ACTN|nr:VOC family protein [Actinoplanes tereljensis]GIF19998.1 glyoxalase [Actinoplanes tereljensis]